MNTERLAFWCAYHEAVVGAEHFYRCVFVRRPPGEIHFHPSCIECVKAAWDRTVVTVVTGS